MTISMTGKCTLVVILDKRDWACGIDRPLVVTEELHNEVHYVTKS
jgi:hypothetical protein